jgi:hypothetical protein
MPTASPTTSDTLTSTAPHSLRRVAALKLTLQVAMLVAVLLGVLLSIGQNYLHDVLRAQIDARLSAVAESRLRMVQAQIDLQRQRVALNAEHNAFHKVLVGAGPASTAALNRLAAQHHLEEIADGTAIRSASLLDATGRVILSSSPADVGRDLHAEPVFQRGLVEADLGMPHSTSDRFDALVGAPVRSDDGPNPAVGVLLLTADLTPLATALHDRTGLGETGETVLGVREDGQVRFLFPLRDTSQVLTSAPADVPPMAAATTGRDFFDSSHDYRGQTVLAVGHPVGYGGWGLVAKMDAAEAYAPITQALRDGLALTTVIVLVGLVAAYGLARHGLTLAERRDVAQVGVALDRLVGGCALAVLGIGLLVLAGWALQIEVLKSLLPGLASMKPNTALGFVLAGLALAQRQRSGLRFGCAAALGLLGGLSLAQDLGGADFGIDQWLFRDTPGAPHTAHPGRMSAITAISFMLCGAALLLLDSRSAALRRTMEALALLAGVAALLALIGYAYGAETLYRLPGFGSIAVHTALAFMLLAIGILGTRADGLAGIFASADLGGQVARRFLPLALLVPLLLGGLAQLGEQAELVSSTQKTAAYAAAMVLVLAALTWRNALLLQNSDAERQ